MDHSSNGMPVRIRIIDTTQNEHWPTQTPVGIRRYLTGLVAHSPAGLAENAAGVDAMVLRVVDAVLPILISDGLGRKASIVSPFGHHVSYPIEEISRQSKYLTQPLLKVILSPLSLLLKAGRIDRVVFINHWLLSGSPEPDVSQDNWANVVSFLSEKFPGHALVLQDIKPLLEPETAKALTQAGGLSVPTRLVNIIDPQRPMAGGKLKKRRYARALARRVYQDSQDELIPFVTASEDYRRICQLYHLSNISRHSELNARYTEHFFELAVECDEFRLHAWHADDQSAMSAFNLQRLDDKFIHWSTFGADETRRDNTSAKHSLYERIAASDLVVAEDTGLLLDWGAGADEFKRLRGAVPYEQYEVVFANHLGPMRRLTWRILAYLRRLRLRQVKAKSDQP